MPITSNQPNQATAAWRACLATAVRTALAGTIVGCLALYGPLSIQRLIAFPAFTYVIVVLIMTDGTLGDTLYSIWLALYATFQSLGPAILSLWLIGPARLNSGSTALAVALGVLVVAQPESTPLMLKRIATGQVVLVYVIAFINGAQTDVFLLSIQLAASTAAGVFACVIALLFPFPRLACLEVKQSYKVLAESAAERLNLYVKALCAEDNMTVSSSISHAKLLTVTSSKLQQTINRYQESMKWETLLVKFLWPNYTNLQKEKLKEVEVVLRGMEMALENFPSSITLPSYGDHFKKSLLILQEHISLNIKQAMNFSPHDSLPVPEPESKTKTITNFIQKFPETHQDLPSFFFLFCMKLLHTKTSQTSSLEKKEHKQSGFGFGLFSFKAIFRKWAFQFKAQKFLPALKYSLSVGLAVLFGCLYSKPNGFWSGLVVATSFVMSREATFQVANVKAQGTVLGSVYGVLICFVSQRFLPMRIVSILPWIVFCSFLRRSRMYGPAGGNAAIIGAIFILGRKNYGPPSEFAIARIMETFIALSCSIAMDLLFRPKRASTLAKFQLSKCLSTLHECLGLLTLREGKASILREKQKQLKLDVEKLGKFIEEAKVEPSFCLLPFNSACHGRLLGSLTKLIDLFHFGAHIMTLLEVESRKLDAGLKKLNNEVKSFGGFASCLMKCLKEISSVTSLAKLLVELNNVNSDVELGKLPSSDLFRVSGSDDKEDQMEIMLNSFLQRSREVVEKIEAVDDVGKEVKSQMVLILSAFGYCMKGFMNEIREIEGGVRERVQWENPTSLNLSLYEISCKIRTLDAQSTDGSISKGWLSDKCGWGSCLRSMSESPQCHLSVTSSKESCPSLPSKVETNLVLIDGTICKHPWD